MAKISWKPWNFPLRCFALCTYVADCHEFCLFYHANGRIHMVASIVLQRLPVVFFGIALILCLLCLILCYILHNWLNYATNNTQINKNFYKAQLFMNIQLPKLKHELWSSICQSLNKFYDNYFYWHLTSSNSDGVVGGTPCEFLILLKCYMFGSGWVCFIVLSLY